MINSVFKFSFWIYIFLVPLIPTSILNRFSYANDLLMIFFIGMFFIKSIYSKAERKKFIFRIKDSLKDLVVITMGISIIVMLISTLYASHKVISVKEAFRYFTYVIIYLAIKYEFNLKYNFKKFKLLIISQSTIVFILGLVQFFTGFGVDEPVYTEGFARMEGTLGHPNSLAAYSILVLFPIMLFIINDKNIKNRILYSIIFVLGIVNIVLSWSRNAWLAFALGLLVLSVIYSIKFLFAIMGAGVVGVIVPFIRERLMQLTSSTINGGRIKLWKAALKMIKDHPIRGIGNGNFIYMYDEYVKKYPELYEFGHSGFPTHNSYLKIWSELGTVGLISFYSTYLIVLVKMFIINKKHKNEYLGFTTAIIVSFIAFMFSNLFDNLLFLPKVTTIFILFISLVLSLDFKESKEEVNNVI